MDWKDGQKKIYNLAKLRGIWKLQLIMYKQGSVSLPAIMNSLRTPQQFKNSPKNPSTYRQRKKKKKKTYKRYMIFGIENRNPHTCCCLKKALHIMTPIL